MQEEQDIMKKKISLGEICKIFTYNIHGGHTEIPIKDGKVQESKHHKNLKDTSCYVCDILNQTRREIMEEVKKNG